MMSVALLDLILCYMDSGTGVGCGNVFKCQGYLIFILRIRGDAEIFIFHNIFLLFSWVDSVYGVITHFMHILIVLVYLFCEL